MSYSFTRLFRSSARIFPALLSSKVAKLARRFKLVRKCNTSSFEDLIILLRISKSFSRIQSGFAYRLCNCSKACSRSFRAASSIFEMKLSVFSSR